MYNKIDFGKVTALLEAGWNIEQVADEMGIKTDGLKEALSRHYK